jgi:hypothetical protein
MINFDSRGYITPNEIVETTIHEFENTFCYNEHRKLIFKNYLNFSVKLQEIGLSNFYQWVDGSFVTTKRYPKDIDFVTFVDYDFFHHNITKMMDLRNEYLDCFFAPIYPQNHSSRFRNDLEHFEWHCLFGWDREDKQKGLIKINFENGNY